MIVICCVYLIPLIILRSISPKSKNVDKNEHASLAVILLISATDLVDFVEYVNIDEIVHYFKGVDEIMGKLEISSNKIF